METGTYRYYVLTERRTTMVHAKMFLCTLHTLRHIPFPFLLILLLPAPTVSAEDRLADYYCRAVAGAEQFVQRFPQTNPMEPVSDFTIYTLFDNIALLVSANADLPQEQRPSLEPITRLLRVAEEMQDKNPESRTFGNFRWNWSNTGITDPNAAEFALARMLSMHFDTPEPITGEARNILNRLLERSVNVCLDRRIRPDYTNIALYNAVHLILLGQVLDHPEVTQEGTRRLQNIAFNIWDHGIFEYNSPAYYFIDVDALQLGLRHADDPQTKQMIRTLLDLFWTDLSLHWYKPGMRLTGAQSRTYNYLFGTSVQMTRHFSFADLAPYDDRARYNGVLNSFRASYQPPPEIVKLNDQYPRWIARNWGPDQGQWAAVYMFDDITLGTAGAKYDARQNMVQVVDMPDEIAGAPAPRSYFIADGREDPYGTKLYPTGRAELRKALHLDALWFGAQRTVDSLGIALYPPEAVADPVVFNVQSHFVVRKPESIWIGDKEVTLSLHQPVNIGDSPVVFRYKTCAFGIRVVWTRHQNGEPAEVFLIDDGNEHGVYRLTVEHGTPQEHDAAQERGALASRLYAGAAFWVRIASRLETEDHFSDWRQQFIAAKVHRLEVKQNDIDIAVAGREGIVAVSLADVADSVITEPAAPMGILTLNGKDLGRPILERIPKIARFARQSSEAELITIDPSGTYWEAESGYAFFEGAVEPDSSASGGLAVRINHDVAWKLQVEQAGEYTLWGRVQTRDPQHDSFFVEAAQRLPDGSFMRRLVNADWHLGVCSDWTWVRLPMPIRLESGVWRLTLKPREYEGRIDQLFLTIDPAGQP